MRTVMFAAGFCLLVGVSASACATSGQEQQRALTQAEDSHHHKASQKAIDEGSAAELNDA